MDDETNFFEAFRYANETLSAIRLLVFAWAMRGMDAADALQGINELITEYDEMIEDGEEDPETTVD